MKFILLLTLVLTNNLCNAQIESLQSFGRQAKLKSYNTDESTIRLLLDMLPSISDSIIKANQTGAISNSFSKKINYPYSYLGSNISYYYVPDKITKEDRVSIHQLFIQPSQGITTEVMLTNIATNLRKSARFTTYFTAVDSGVLYGSKFIVFEQQATANNKGLSSKLNSELDAVAKQNPLQVKLQTKQDGLVKYVAMQIAYGENKHDKIARLAKEKKAVLKNNSEINFQDGRLFTYKIFELVQSKEDAARAYPYNNDSLTVKIINIKEWLVEWQCKAIQQKKEIAKATLNETNAMYYENQKKCGKEKANAKLFLENFKIDQFKLSNDLYNKCKNRRLRFPTKCQQKNFFQNFVKFQPKLQEKLSN